MAWEWGKYTAPNMAPQEGVGGNFNFYRPQDSKLPTGQALQSYLTQSSDPNAITNRTIKYDGGLTREMLGNTTGYLNDAMGSGFQQMSNDMQQYSQYGGLFGNQGSGTYSPQSQNGYGQGLGQNNPWKIGSF